MEQNNILAVESHLYQLNTNIFYTLKQIFRILRFYINCVYLHKTDSRMGQMKTLVMCEWAAISVETTLVLHH